MKTIRITLGALVAVCALGALAASASAEGFESTGGELKGSAQNEQVFTIGASKAIRIRCGKAKVAGSLAAGPLLGITEEVKLTGCTYGGRSVKFAEPLELEYKNPIRAEEGNTVTIVRSDELKIGAIQCIATIDEQSLPLETANEKYKAPAVYSTEIVYKGGKKFEQAFPEGQKKLIIQNNVKALEWELEPIREGKGLCAEFESRSGENGTFTGRLAEEIKGGQLWPVF